MGYPDKVRDSAFFEDSRWFGAGWKALPSDLSSPRLGERAFKLLDDMSNWGLAKKLMGEVVHGYPVTRNGQNKEMALAVPVRLASFCRQTPERRVWLDRLPAALRSLEVRWSLTLGRPFDNASCAWVAPVHRMDGCIGVWNASTSRLSRLRF
jgi:hypothetical protein